MVARKTNRMAEELNGGARLQAGERMQPMTTRIFVIPTCWQNFSSKNIRLLNQLVEIRSIPRPRYCFGVTVERRVSILFIFIHPLIYYQKLATVVTKE